MELPVSALESDGRSDSYPCSPRIQAQLVAIEMHVAEVEKKYKNYRITEDLLYMLREYEFSQFPLVKDVSMDEEGKVFVELHKVDDSHVVKDQPLKDVEVSFEL